MRKLLAALVSVLFLLGMAAAQDMSPEQHMRRMTASVPQNLMDMERKWAELGKADNPEALAPMLSDNFVNLDSDGTVHTKPETLERMRKAKWEVNEVVNMKVTENGSTAIVTGTWRGKGVDGTGKDVDTSERFVDTWTRMSDGKWRCLASASATIKPEQTAKE